MESGKELDDALRYIGFLGRYNVLQFAHLIIFTSVFPAAFTLALVFITSEPASYSCALPDAFPWNATAAPTDGNSTDEFDDNCHMYKIHDGNVTPNVTSCQYGWEYSYTYGETTIVSEFDLVCDRRLLKDTAQTVYMSGLLLGAFPMGHLCDRFGRKIVTFSSILLMGISGLGLAFSYNYYVFVIMWFLVGVFRQGILTSGLTLMIEMLPPEKRALCGMAVNMGWATGVVSLAPLAIGLRDWRHLQLVLSTGIFIALPFYCLITESGRWLLSQHRFDEAEQTLQMMARRNRVKPPTKFLQAPENEVMNATNWNATGCEQQTSDDDANQDLQYSEVNAENDGRQHIKLTVLDLFKSPNLARNTIILTLDWVAASTTYYGLSLNSTNLAGNMYLNFFLLGLAEMPSAILSYFTIEYAGGRKLSTAISILVSGIACVVTAWMPSRTASGTDLTSALIASTMIGKFAISYAWGVIVIYTPELFPTSVRSSANGFCSSVSRIGGMLAPFIVRLNDVSPYLPLNIFEIISIIAGILTFLLPETRNVPLPETLEEGEMMGKTTEVRSKDHKDIN